MFALICEYTYGVFGAKKVLIRRDFYRSVCPGSCGVVTALVFYVWVDVVENFFGEFSFVSLFRDCVARATCTILYQYIYIPAPHHRGTVIAMPRLSQPPVLGRELEFAEPSAPPSSRAVLPEYADEEDRQASFELGPLFRTWSRT